MRDERSPEDGVFFAFMQLGSHITAVNLSPTSQPIFETAQMATLRALLNLFRSPQPTKAVYPFEPTIDIAKERDSVESPLERPSKTLVWLITGKSILFNLYVVLTADLLTLGTSSGFGRRLVRSALLRGDCVIGTVRSVKDPNDEYIPNKYRGNLKRIELDVTEGEDVLKRKVDEAAKFWGRIDVLVNNAGQGLVGLSEEGGYAYDSLPNGVASAELSTGRSKLFRRTFDVNFFGMIDMTTAALPYLRESEGRIVNIGSRSAWKTDVMVRFISTSLSRPIPLT